MGRVDGSGSWLPISSPAHSRATEIARWAHWCSFGGPQARRPIHIGRNAHVARGRRRIPVDRVDRMGSRWPVGIGSIGMRKSSRREMQSTQFKSDQLTKAQPFKLPSSRRTKRPRISTARTKSQGDCRPGVSVWKAPSSRGQSRHPQHHESEQGCSHSRRRPSVHTSSSASPHPASTAPPSSPPPEAQEIHRVAPPPR
jgi:hypothetical protein